MRRQRNWDISQSQSGVEKDRFRESVDVRGGDFAGIVYQVKRQHHHVRLVTKPLGLQEQVLLIRPPPRHTRVDHLPVATRRLESTLKHLRKNVPIPNAVPPRKRISQHEHSTDTRRLLVGMLAIPQASTVDRQPVPTRCCRPVRYVPPTQSLVIEIIMTGLFVAGFLHINRHPRIKQLAKPLHLQRDDNGDRQHQHHAHTQPQKAQRTPDPLAEELWHGLTARNKRNLPRLCLSPPQPTTPVV